MVGLPGQTLRDLAGDIRFFKDLNAHMIGMGPYITEAGTPVAGEKGLCYYLSVILCYFCVTFVLLVSMCW